MLAYQLIYTACGKDKSGAFSIWSQSAGITRQESNEIIAIAAYKKAPNTPFNPTPEEMALYFPPKFAYWTLSSGRQCVARSTFVGQVYSDLDKRSGNYVLHAYVFDKPDGFNPYSIFTSDMFKTSLSYSEWHDNDAPAELPAVELHGNVAANESAVREWLLGRKSETVNLLQAAINAANGTANVSFNDSEENQIKLYTLLGMLLPASVLNKLSFSTQYSVQTDYNLTSVGGNPVKLRNIFVGMLGAFNYPEAQASGNYTFNFERNICSQVPAGKYVTDIVESFEKGSSLFNVLKKVETVNSIMVKSGCDVDTAIGVYYVSQKNLNYFANAEQFAPSLELALKIGAVTEQSVADIIMNDIVRTGRWGQGKAILPLVKLVYRCGDAATRSTIIEGYFASLAAYGVTVNAPAAEMYAQAKACAPFDWNDVVADIARNPNWEKYPGTSHSVGELYTVFDSAVQAVRGGTQSQSAFKLLTGTLANILGTKSLDFARLFVASAANLSESVLRKLTESTLGSRLTTPLSDEASLEFLFRFVLLLPANVRQDFLNRAVECNLNSPQFMRVYVGCSSADPAAVTAVENRLKATAYYADFVKRKDMYKFQNATDVTLPMLLYYYNRYFVKNQDNGTFVKKVQAYLSRLEGDKKFASVLELYKLARSCDLRINDAVELLSALARAVFSLPTEQLLKLVPAHLSEVKELCDKLTAMHRDAPAKSQLVFTVLLLRGALPELVLADNLKSNKVYIGLDNAQLKEIVTDYFNDVLTLYCKRRNTSQLDEALFRCLFEVPVVNLPQLHGEIAKQINKLPENGLDMWADLMAYAFNFNDRLATELVKLVKEYLNDVNNVRANNKFLAKVVEKISEPKRAAVEAFANEYEDEHLGFFGRMKKRNREKREERARNEQNNNGEKR